MRGRVRTTQRSSRRRGAVMVVAVICLMLVTALLASALKSVTTGRKQVRQEQMRLQAVWLAEAGLERAAAQVAANADYAGETWKIAAADLDGIHTGRVVITVQPGGDAAEMRRVKVTATYPEATVRSAQITLSAKVKVGNE